MLTRWLGPPLLLLSVLIQPLGAAPDTALVQAAAGGDMAAVRQLLRKGGDVNAADPDGATPLHWVVRADDVDTATALLRAGARVSTSTALGITPVYIAAENGSAAMLGRLLDAGANSSTTDASGDTLLMAAVRAGSRDAVELLLDRGAAVNAVDAQFGHNALMWAARRNDTAIMRLLIARGATVDSRTRVGEPPIKRPPGTGGGSHGVGIVRGGVPSQGEQQPTSGGMTPLLFAARDGQLDAAGLLVKAGADVNAPDPNGITPLLMALTNGQLAVATFLIDQGADPQRTDWWGRAPLWAAVDIRNLAVRSGTPADENGIDREAGLQVISALLERGVDVNARVKEFPPMRRYLLPLGSLEWVDVTGQTAFIRAAQAGDVATMRLLLARGADPNITTFNETTALMTAAGVNWVVGETFSESPARWIEAVQLCLDLGLDVNAVNKMGLQAIHGAANRGSDDIIELLARHGAQLDRPDREGRTPYAWAQGVFLATNSPVAKPSTMALLERLTHGAATARRDAGTP
ncbi:MAG: ankyrin repeat domain-containing protein [Acidobacteriota bacterium]